MKKTSRIEEVKNLIIQRGFCSVNDLLDAIDASQSTIRRDLTILEKEGFIERYHGGAASPEYAMLSHISRMKINREEKEEIGKKAALLVEDNQTVILDAGSTASMLGNNLIKKKGLTVITTAVNIARQLSAKDDFSVIMTGGILDSETHSLTGHLAEVSFKQIHADIAFIACDSIAQTLKVMYTSFEISELMKTILEAAVVKVLIADHSKFGKVDIASIGSIAQFDKLVVDSKLADDYVQKIRDLGVEVIT